MRLRFLLLAALQFTAAFSLSSCGYQYFKRVVIDPTSLKVTCYDSVGGLFNPAPPGGVYGRLACWNGNTIVEYLNKIESPASWIRYDYMLLNEHGQLVDRSKYQILAQGDFGIFYGRTSYHYGSKTEKRIDFTVAALYRVQSEPAEVKESAEAVPGSLSVISIIRAFRTPTGYSLGGACYTPTGKLLSVSQRKAKSTESGEGGETRYRQNLMPERFGFPTSFPVKEYGQGDRGVLVSSDPTVLFEAVNFHYDRNRQVQQDFRNRGEDVHSRILRYNVTPEDTMLAPIDDKCVFADYR